MYPNLFRLMSIALVAAVSFVAGQAHAGEAYGVGPHLCGSFANAMANMARGRELGGGSNTNFNAVLAGRRDGAKVCRGDPQVSKLGCPSDEFIVSKATQAWEMSGHGNDADTVGQFFYDECVNATGAGAPDLGKRL